MGSELTAGVLMVLGMTDLIVRRLLGSWSGTGSWCAGVRVVTVRAASIAGAARRRILQSAPSVTLAESLGDEAQERVGSLRNLSLPPATKSSIDMIRYF